MILQNLDLSLPDVGGHEKLLFSDSSYYDDWHMGGMEFAVFRDAVNFQSGV